MKGAGKFEGSSSKIVFEDSEEDEDLSCSSVSSSDEVSSFRIVMELKTLLLLFVEASVFECGIRKKKQKKS